MTVEDIEEELAACETALRTDPTRIQLLLKKGDLLTARAAALPPGSPIASRLDNYENAVLAFEIVLGIEPRSSRALMGCASVLSSISRIRSQETVHGALRRTSQRLGPTAADQGWLKDALAAVKDANDRAVDACQAAAGILGTREGYIALGQALEYQSVWLSSMEPDIDLAIEAGVQAIAALGHALTLQLDIDILSRMAHIRQFLGQLYLRRRDHMAITAFEAAAEDFLAVSQLDRSHSVALTHRAEALSGVAQAWGLVTTPPDIASARSAAEIEAPYLRGLRAFDEALASGSDGSAAVIGKAELLLRLGNLQEEAGRPHEALFSYREACRSLEILPESPPVGLRSEAFERLGDLQARLSLVAEAIESYKRGVQDIENRLPRTGGSGGYDDLARGRMLLQIGKLGESLGSGDTGHIFREARATLEGVVRVSNADKIRRDQLLEQIG